jgi:Kdo2-lipid IVA lauroyltransferase/acyltransferase
MGRKTHQATLQLRGRLATGMLRLMASLPLATNRAFGWLIGWLLWLLNGDSRRVTEINLERCLPDLSAQQRRLLARQSLIETGKGMTELGWIWHHQEQALALSRGGNSEFDAALKSGTPIIILAPHLGCWEVLNFWLAQQAPMHAMFLPSGIDRLDNLVRASREKIGSTMHPATARGVATLVRALKKGHSLTAILPDQVADRRGGRFADFYGHPAWTGTLSSKLIQQSGAQVFMAFAKRLPAQNGYEIVMQPADQDIYAEDIGTSLAGLNRSIEALIAEAPAQYLWSYKRFRRAPEGQTKPY